MDYLLAVPAAILTAASLVSFVFERPADRRIGPHWIALGALALALGLLVRLTQVGHGLGAVLVEWSPVARARVAVAFHVDAISATLAILGALLCLVVLLPVAGPSASSAGRRAWPSLAAMAALLVALFSADLVIAYVALELLALFSYLLARQSGGTAATRAYAVAHASGYALLAAVLLLAFASGGSSLVAIVDPSSFGGVVPTLVALAALGRLTQSWLTAQGGDGPAPGLPSTLGNIAAAYLLFRTLFLVGGAWPGIWGSIAVIAGVVLALAGLVRMRQRRRLVSYLTGSGWVDAGLLLGAVGLGTPLALAAGLLQVANLCLVRPALVSWLALAEGDRRRTWPAAAIGAVSLTGVPPLLGFSARWLLCVAAWQQGQWPLVATVALVVLASVPAAVEALAGEFGQFASPQPQATVTDELASASPTDSSRGEALPTIVLTVAAVGLALVPAFWVYVVNVFVTAFAPEQAEGVRQIALGGAASSAPFLLVLVVSTVGLGVARAAPSIVGDRRARHMERMIASTGAESSDDPISRQFLGLAGRLAGLVERAEADLYLPVSVFVGVVVLLVFAG